MLHILWILFKFILILLVILAVLILLTIALILFCPVRYQAVISKEAGSFQNSSISTRISWLFGMISLRLNLQNGKSTQTDFRIFGIPIQKIKNIFPKHNIADSKQKSMDQQPDNPKDFPQSSEPIVNLPESDISSASQSSTEKAESFFFKLGMKCRTIFDHINNFLKKIGKIPASIQTFTLTVQNLCAKIKSYQNFLDSPRIKAALSLIKKDFIKVLTHVLPTKIKGKIIFGSTDPSITGSILAILGMTMPIHQNCISVIPIFEDRDMLDIHASVKGRIYGFVLLKTAAELYFNKNIKYLIRRWKHKED